MVRQPDHADSATSQFFINLTDNPSLNPRGGEGTDKDGYCVFGEVVEGMDVVDRIAEVAVADRGPFPQDPRHSRRHQICRVDPLDAHECSLRSLPREEVWLFEESWASATRKLARGC